MFADDLELYFHHSIKSYYFNQASAELQEDVNILATTTSYLVWRFPQVNVSISDSLGHILIIYIDQ